MTHSLTITTSDLLAAVRDVRPFTSRDHTAPESAVLLHARGDLLAATACTDPDATVAATASLTVLDGHWPTAAGYLLTPDGLRHLDAYSTAARRPEGQPPHEVTLTLTGSGSLTLTEAGGLFPSTADVTLKPVADLDDWPLDAVNVAIAGQLDPDMPPAAVMVQPDWMQRVCGVAKRRTAPYRLHSASQYRVLASVAADWTASLPALTTIPTRVHAGDVLGLDLQEAA